MIRVDLEQFANTGMLGPFDSQTTRKQIVEILGPPEHDSYPDFAKYTHLSFDLAGGEGPPCGIQIAFPHATHMRPAHSGWTDWKVSTCFDQWPDRRLHWNLGRFIPGLNVEEAIAMLPNFEEAEVIFSSNGLRILHSSIANVDLLFEYDTRRSETTLSVMVAHPQIETK